MKKTDLHQGTLNMLVLKVFNREPSHGSGICQRFQQSLAMSRRLIAVVLVFIACAGDAAAQSRVETNVVYGMYSGLALLLDVHYPAAPNGYGVVFVAGSGWRAPLGYGATGLKEAEGQISLWGPPLLRAGYTVFAINHRAAPRFQYPAALEDVQRAVRFVRHNARRFGVDGTMLGGVGGLSGGHLVVLVATLGAPGKTDDPDPVNREPATLQAVVLRAAPSDMRLLGATPIGGVAVGSFMGRAFKGTTDDDRDFGAASPIAHVSSSSPPTLLLHGDADDTVPYQQSLEMERALRRASVPVKLVRVAGGAHGATFTMDTTPHAQLPAVLDEMIGWLGRYMKTVRAK
ncbi:MAG: alpha/beta hydrolase fold domain-containing protein [Verrucomicrobia bacterium]|nr:alpha/beta hydrolase fold domain-containing protein [Verrucomicrobiota bacterium]